MKTVWIVATQDYGYSVESIHETEIAALRHAVNLGYHAKVMPIEFGTVISDVINK